MLYSDKLDVYVFDSLEEMEKISNTANINEYIFNKIVKLLDNDLDKTVLFHINVDGMLYSTIISKETVLPPLEKCLEKFEAHENYEMCQICLDVIKSL